MDMTDFSCLVQLAQRDAEFARTAERARQIRERMGADEHFDRPSGLAVVTHWFTARRRSGRAQPHPAR